ncbi:hypothetical protein [Polaromonas hydrogenivorans]|uniref:Uncharacterized protein n=1 Tax=Polaromonas hydrogenivorans TaxID=335476 RepID=A0AAU7M0V4_9BURK
MNLTNWTTRFQAGNARNCKRQPDGQGSKSDSANVATVHAFVHKGDHQYMPETIACFASERDVSGSWPPSVFGDDFSELPAVSLDEVRQAFARAATHWFAEGRFQIDFKLFEK